MTAISHLFPSTSWADCRAELARELAHRRRTYPDRVNTGRMKQADAEYQIAIFAAIASDIDRMANPVRPEPVGAVGDASHQRLLSNGNHSFTWAERRAAIERELAFRDRFYPQWTASGRMTAAQADRQCTALRAVLWRYDAGFDWIADNGAACQWGTVTLDAATNSARQQARSIWGPNGPYQQRYYPAAEPQQTAFI